MMNSHSMTLVVLSFVAFASVNSSGTASVAVAATSFPRNSPELIQKITKAPTAPPQPTNDDYDKAESKTEPAPSPESASRSEVVSEPAPGTAGAATKEEHSAPTTAPSHEHHASSPGVPAEQALKWLQNGNTRYVKNRFRADGRGETDRKRLIAAQKPHAIVLSCADSRVPPEIIFDQMLGEIFTIRVAGEALDSSVIASIEYALEHLGSKLLVVMGHTKCGAVDAALKIHDGESSGSKSLDLLLGDIRPHLKTVTTQKPSHDLEVEATLNADGVARDLLKRSEIVRKKVESGELLIKPALYRLDSGKVSFY